MHTRNNLLLSPGIKQCQKKKRKLRAKRRNTALTASPLKVITGRERESKNPLLCLQLANTHRAQTWGPEQSLSSVLGQGSKCSTPRVCTCQRQSPSCGQSTWCCCQWRKPGSPSVSFMFGWVPETVTSGTVLCQDLGKGRGSVHSFWGTS